MKPIDKTGKNPAARGTSSNKNQKKVEKGIGGIPKGLQNPTNTVVPVSDVFRLVGDNLERKDKKSLREVSKASKALVPPGTIVINGNDLTHMPTKSLWEKLENAASLVFGNQSIPYPKSIIEEKSEVAETNNLKIAIVIKDTPKEIAQLTKFLENPDNQKYLKNIASISVGNVDLYNTNFLEIQDLFDTIAKKSNELTNLNSITVSARAHENTEEINIPENLPANLRSLRCSISNGILTLPKTFPNKLETMYLNAMFSNINFPKQLSSASLRSIECWAEQNSTINYPDIFPKTCESIYLVVTFQGNAIHNFSQKVSASGLKFIYFFNKNYAIELHKDEVRGINITLLSSGIKVNPEHYDSSPSSLEYILPRIHTLPRENTISAIKVLLDAACQAEINNG